MNPALCTPVRDTNSIHAMAAWLSRYNHNENKDEKIAHINVNINAIQMCTDIPEYKMAGEIRHATQKDDQMY